MYARRLNLGNGGCGGYNEGMTATTFIPLEYDPVPADEMQQRAAAIYANMKRRRTVRQFADRPVPRDVIVNCLLAAGTAPSGANLQPWHFVVISDPALKRRIRLAAEVEERDFYERRAPPEWLAALAGLGTDADKPFLETAPYLIVVFAQSYSRDEAGQRRKHYYVQESVGIATGMLIAAIHQAGLVSLTHTPSPMAFLSDILERPPGERPYLILVVGYPADDAVVPVIAKKSLDELATFMP